MSEKFVPHIELHSEATGLRNHIRTATGHTWIADEPAALGGTDTGPNPFEMVCAALAACTSMTLRMYSDLKKWPLTRVDVTVEHEQVEAATSEAAQEKGISEGKVDLFRRDIKLTGDLDEAQRTRMIGIANKCPVHRALVGGTTLVVTKEIV